MNMNDYLHVIIIFALSIFFSYTSWINKKLVSGADLKQLEGLTHAASSALLSVVVYTGMDTYMHDWSLYFKGSVSIACGAFLSESLIALAKRKVDQR